MKKSKKDWCGDWWWIRYNRKDELDGSLLCDTKQLCVSSHILFFHSFFLLFIAYHQNRFHCLRTFMCMLYCLSPLYPPCSSCFGGIISYLFIYLCCTHMIDLISIFFIFDIKILRNIWSWRINLKWCKHKQQFIKVTFFTSYPKLFSLWLQFNSKVIPVQVSNVQTFLLHFSIDQIIQYNSTFKQTSKVINFPSSFHPIHNWYLTYILIIFIWEPTFIH